ncbi:hypothetical protein LPB86_03810 [Pedobacter sp. MC2016-14]|uniref:hypothetical protein n=1 Tax=Pedobacter sp. MC2016-14 TaxID=2897327 RepID=UPI001E505646|nr:hypothetical protein [Pedobacter sp. MC2016-14]MCD0487340.1 hypothetical protein [Pedobacter sp. MC2016-14]
MKKIIFIGLLILNNLFVFVVSNLIFLSGTPNYDENPTAQKPLFYDIHPEFSALMYLALVGAFGAIFTVILFWTFDYKYKRIGLGTIFFMQFVFSFGIEAWRRLVFYL